MELKTRELNNIIIFDLEGEIKRPWDDKITLHRHVKNHLKEGKINFLLNFDKVEFMDSNGVGELIASLQSTRDLGGKLKLTKLPPRIKDIFEITGLINIFENFDDEEEAIISFS